MVAALYSSRRGGSKKFNWDRSEFGWESIEDMFKRELHRIQSGQIPRVPGLKESYIYRDTWTRLNVKPAKIVQVSIDSSSYACVDI